MTERHRIESDKQPDPTPSEQGENVDVNAEGTRATIPTENPSDGARPEWLPEKFDSPEAMAKSYAELEKKFSSERTSEEAPAVPEPKADAEEGEALTDATIRKVEKAVEESPKIDFEGLGNEYIENGGLTDETYTDLEAKGLPRNVIDAYLEGQKAIAAKATSELAGAVGGPEAFQTISKWAGENLTETQLASYNKAVDTADFATAKLLLQGIASEYRSAVGSDPKLVKGEGTPRTSGVQPFSSNAEMVKAINDPRYQTDPNYREEVQRKIQAG